jgi:hypothetical protein
VKSQYGCGLYVEYANNITTISGTPPPPAEYYLHFRFTIYNNCSYICQGQRQFYYGVASEGQSGLAWQGTWNVDYDPQSGTLHGPVIESSPSSSHIAMVNLSSSTPGCNVYDAGVIYVISINETTNYVSSTLGPPPSAVVVTNSIVWSDLANLTLRMGNGPNVPISDTIVQSANVIGIDLFSRTYILESVALHPIDLSIVEVSHDACGDRMIMSYRARSGCKLSRLIFV